MNPRDASQPRKMLRGWRWVLAIYWCSHALATHWPGLTIASPQVNGKAIPLDKPIHLISYVGLTLLLALAKPRGNSGTWRGQFHLAAAIALIYAVLDELTQGWTGRTVSGLDLAANVVGVMMVWLGAWLVPWMLGHDTRFAEDDTSLPDAHAIADALPHEGDKPRPRSFVRNALTVGSLTFASRITGLARDAVIAFTFGLGSVTDAFYLGFLVPNLFRRLFGEGALTAAFIPVYTDLTQRDPQMAQRLATLMVAGLATLLAGITLLGEAALWWMRHANWTGDTLLALRLTMLMLPYMPLVCVTALLGGILQVHHRFGPAALAPIILNLAMILAAGVAAFLISNGQSPRDAIVVVGLAVLLAGVMQVIWMLLGLRRLEVFAAAPTLAKSHAKKILLVMLPMIVGLAVFQINTLLDSLLAMALSPKVGGATSLQLFGWTAAYPIRENGAVAALSFAQRLYQFPLGVFGIALATAIFPALSLHAARHENAAFSDTLQRGLRLALFIGLPASAGLILVRVPLTRLMFQRGEFTGDDAQRVAAILCGYAAAVWAYAATHVLTRAFYARQDARTPLRISAGMVGLNLLLNLMLVWYLGAAGLAWSTALCAAGQVALLITALARRMTNPVDRTVVKSWLTSLGLSVIMFAGLWPLTRVWDLSHTSTATTAMVLLLLVCLGAGIVLVLAKLTRMSELSWLLKHK